MAPNMVTLVGFFFILGNVALLVIFMPDLIGPVCGNLDSRICWVKFANTFEGPWLVVL